MNICLVRHQHIKDEIDFSPLQLPSLPFYWLFQPWWSASTVTWFSDNSFSPNHCAWRVGLCAKKNNNNEGWRKVLQCHNRLTRNCFVYLRRCSPCKFSMVTGLKRFWRFSEKKFECHAHDCESFENDATHASDLPGEGVNWVTTFWSHHVYRFN